MVIMKSYFKNFNLYVFTEPFQNFSITYQINVKEHIELFNKISA